MLKVTDVKTFTETLSLTAYDGSDYDKTISWEEITFQDEDGREITHSTKGQLIDGEHFPGLTAPYMKLFKPWLAVKVDAKLSGDKGADLAVIDGILTRYAHFIWEATDAADYLTDTYEVTEKPAHYEEILLAVGELARMPYAEAIDEFTERFKHLFAKTYDVRFFLTKHCTLAAVVYDSEGRVESSIKF